MSGAAANKGEGAVELRLDYELSRSTTRSSRSRTGSESSSGNSAGFNQGTMAEAQWARIFPRQHRVDFARDVSKTCVGLISQMPPMLRKALGPLTARFIQSTRKDPPAESFHILESIALLMSTHGFYHDLEKVFIKHKIKIGLQIKLTAVSIVPTDTAIVL
jgi:hypothetical protein